MLLAQWYGVSDPEPRDALSDRLSFRRFAPRRGRGVGPVRRAMLTPANVTESLVADALPLGDEVAVRVDKIPN